MMFLKWGQSDQWVPIGSNYFLLQGLYSKLPFADLKRNLNLNSNVLFLMLEVKRLKKIGTGELEKIEYFYLSQPITLHPQNSIFFYPRTYPEWPGKSIFSYPLVYPPTEVLSIFFSIFCDRALVSFSIPHLSSIVQILIFLYIPQYLFLSRNEEYSSKKYRVHFT